MSERCLAKNSCDIFEFVIPKEKANLSCLFEQGKELKNNNNKHKTIGLFQVVHQCISYPYNYNHYFCL